MKSHDGDVFDDEEWPCLRCGVNTSGDICPECEKFLERDSANSVGLVYGEYVYSDCLGRD